LDISINKVDKFDKKPHSPEKFHRTLHPAFLCLFSAVSEALRRIGIPKRKTLMHTLQLINKIKQRERKSGKILEIFRQIRY